METWKHRLVVEHADLHEKLTKLIRFRNSNSWSLVRPLEQRLLEDQIVHMTEYLRVLGQRLEIHSL